GGRRCEVRAVDLDHQVDLLRRHLHRTGGGAGALRSIHLHLVPTGGHVPTEVADAVGGVGVATVGGRHDVAAVGDHREVAVELVRAEQGDRGACDRTTPLVGDGAARVDVDVERRVVTPTGGGHVGADLRSTRLGVERRDGGRVDA